MIERSNEARGRESEIEQYSTEGMGFSAGVDQAISDNLVYKARKFISTVADVSPRVPREEALKRAQEAGVKLEINDDEQDIGKRTLELLIERQYERKLNAHIMAQSGGAIAPYSGQLAGSFLDPINVALNFVPVVGPARYAKMLDQASFIKRSMIRAGVGATEGAVGATMAEPFNFLLSKSLRDDYTMADSLMNVGIGGVMGSILHFGFGTTGDIIKQFKGKKTPGIDEELSPEIISTNDVLSTPITAEPLNLEAPEVKERIEAEVNQRVEALPVKKQEALMEQSVTQLAHDMEVRVDKTEVKIKNEFYKKIIEIDKKIEDYANDGRDFTNLAKERKELLKVVDYNQYQIQKTEADIEDLVRGQLDTMLDEVNAAQKTGLTSYYVDVDPNKAQGNAVNGQELRFSKTTKKDIADPFPDYYSEIGFKNKDEFRDVIENPYDKRYKNKQVFKPKYLKLMEVAKERLERGYGTNEMTGSPPDAAYLDLVNRKRELENRPAGLESLEDPFPFGIDEQAETAVASVKETAKDFDNVEENLEAYEALTSEEIQQIKDQFANAEDPKVEALIHDAEATIKNIDAEAKESKDIMKALANCALRGLNE